MSRRTFNGSERIALYMAAGGKCEICGVELGKGWHADHKHPFSKGGATDVTNGSALCPTCNLKKGNSIMSNPHEIWQQEAETGFMEHQASNYLVTACPGAGKTRLALRIASKLMGLGEISRVIVVVPTKQLTQQWSKSAAKFDIDITSQFNNRDVVLTAAKHGASVTYAQVHSNPDLWRILTSEVNTLVIFDEIHHVGEADHAAWGASIKHAFDGAVKRLLLSGTPFRTDGTEIPYVNYINGLAESHYSLGYGKAVMKRITRPVRFEMHDGEASYVDTDGQLIEVDLSKSTEEQRSGVLSTAFKPDNAWIPSIMKKADDELTRSRYDSPDAGGLILAPSRRLAETYASMMGGICGEKVPFVHSDMDEDPSQIIEQFANGSTRWLVSVDMVSEGVDIPRLTVGVYASRKMTEMWFRQVVGRFTRMRGADDDTTSTILIPAIEPISEMARRIEEEANVALREMEKLGREAVERSRQLQINIVEPLSASESILAEVATSGQVATDGELAIALDIQQRVGGSLRTAHLGDIALALRLANGGQTIATSRVDVPTSQAITSDDERHALKKQLKRKVSTLNRITGTEYGVIYGKLNEMFGGTVPTSDADGLRKRIAQVDDWVAFS